MKAKKSESSSPAPKARGRSLARGEERALREVCAFIDAHCDSGEPLRLDALAKRAGFSASSLRRLFRRELGVTPRQYVEARRFERLRGDLRGEGERSITDSIYQAGFASPSRVYEQTGERLGMTLSEYRAGGRGVEISYALVATEFGPLMIAATDRGLCSVR
ncbi:MAG: helix-turn-helix domain-containing protein, partial [Acidobacteriota bacterium]